MSRLLCPNPKCSKGNLKWVTDIEADDLLESGVIECQGCKKQFVGIPGWMEAMKEKKNKTQKGKDFIMKIVEITRTVSGLHFDNVSAKAALIDEDDPVKVAVDLDSVLEKALNEINKKNATTREARQEKNDTVSLLKDALDYAKKQDIPF